MSTRKEDIFRKVVKYADTELPAPDFTAIIMKEVIADFKDETVMNPDLILLIKEHSTENPLPDFTSNVMALVELHNSKAVYNPVISKRVGYLIAAGMIGVISLFLFSKKTAGIGTGQGLISSSYYHILGQIQTVPSLYLMAIILICILLWADHLFSNYRNSATS